MGKQGEPVRIHVQGLREVLTDAAKMLEHGNKQQREWAAGTLRAIATILPDGGILVASDI